MVTRPGLAALAFVVLLLVGCATPYQPTGATGGYSEKKLDSDLYEVTFTGNGYTGRETVFRSWLYRCAEITAQQGYDWFVVLGTPVRTSGLDPQNFIATGFDSPEYERTKGGGGGAPIYIYSGGGGGVVRFSARAVIRLRKGNMTPDVPMAYAARDVMRDLREEVLRIATTTTPSETKYKMEDVFGGPGGTVRQVDNDVASRVVTLDDLGDLLPTVR